ncbi:MAG: Maf family protein [Peptoniphilus sp.]|nr:Maf family protein [Peptoniphilus sp.]MDY3118541.1 Maf family protein [Peptoniphilus sp.]
MTLVLASSSPRRRELLARAGLSFKVEAPSYDERRLRMSPPAIYGMQLAYQKALSVKENRLKDVIVAADTVVVLDGRILGKPKDRAEAEAMLRALRGREHAVISAYCVLGAKKYVDYDVSRVVFEEFSDAQMRAYLDKNTYMDKAGAYGVQEIDEFSVRVLDAVDTVVGLHVDSILRALEGEGYGR